MLFETLDRIKRIAITGAIVFMFFGWMLLVMPNEIIPLVGNVVAFALSVYAVVRVLSFIASNKVLIDCVHLFIGLLAGSVGVMLFAFNDLFENTLSILMSVVPILLGLYGMYCTYAYGHGSNRRGLGVPIFVFAMLIATGAFVAWNPWFDDSVDYMRVIGATLVYTAIASILSLIWIWPIREEEV